MKLSAFVSSSQKVKKILERPFSNLMDADPTIYSDVLAHFASRFWEVVNTVVHGRALNGLMQLIRLRQTLAEPIELILRPPRPLL